MGTQPFALDTRFQPGTLKVPLWVLLVATEVLDLLSYGFHAMGIVDFGVSHTDGTRE